MPPPIRTIPPPPPPPPLKKRLRESFVHVPRTIGLVWRASRKGTLALGLLTLAASLLPLGIAYVAKLIVDAVLAKSGALAFQWVLLEGVLVALQAFAMRGQGLVRQVLGARLGLDINIEILEKAITLELRHFEDPEVYDSLTKARREASARPISVVLDTFHIIQNTITLAGYVVIIAGYSGWVVLGLIAASIPATIAEVKLGQAAFRLRNWRSPDSRKLNYLEYVLANDDHAKEVKVFGFGRLLLDRYKELGETFFREDRDLAVRRAGWAYALSLLATGAFYASYLSMAVAAAAGAITLGQMALYVLAFRQGQQGFQAILSAIGSMYEHNLYMSNLFEFLAMETAPPRIAQGERELRRLAEGASEPVGEEHGIRFENVGFQYPGRDDWALRNIDLFLPRGRKVALVGHNGAGKTTFIKLLTRLYEPTEGRILLDGKDLAEHDPETVRQRIGVVFQDFGQYKLKARETVGIGSVTLMDDEAQVERAVELGGASEVVEQLPERLDTQLGRWFTGGVELSGGQWQKMALARAFMRKDADILILDEPTAALDAEAEHAVFERFQRLSEGKTSLVISHRFPTVRLAERILVLEKGHIVEQGTHEELLVEDGLYARLFSLQAQGYT